MLIKKERIPVVHILLIGFLPSFFKKIVYRLKGYRIGKNVSLSLGCVLIGKQVSIGDNVKIGFLTIIRGRQITIERFVKIGSMTVIDTEKIFIDEDARINEQVYIGGMKTPQSSFHLGKRTIIMQLSYLNPTLPITIGDDSGIGGHCLFFTHGSWNSQLQGFPVKFAPITLGKKVWLPWRVFVMPGATIGDNVVIGANSLVNAAIPSNSLATGNPAKVIKENFPRVPDESSALQMTNKIIDDFVEYIQYFDFLVDDKKENASRILSLSNNEMKSVVVFHSSGDKTSPPPGDNALILFKASVDEVKKQHANGYKTVLSLSDTCRIGTSNCGEEITVFFSRYGVRFSRLD